ncbi:MAG: 30S ribosomal protein S16 [Candidatus Omnitrophota bacterium]
MSVVIRLKRIGTTKKPVNRIVVADSRFPRDGRFIERLGYYDPRRDPAVIEINKERAEYWLSVGAKPSVAVKALFKKKEIK